MSDKLFFSKGVFCSPADFSGVDENFKDIIVETLNAEGVYGEKINIQKNSENQIYTSFLIDIDNNSYLLKITFDYENETFNNEIDFLKNNKFKITPDYICSGYLKSNTKIKFLLIKNELGRSIKDLGSNFFFDNIDSFFASFFILNNCESDNLASDYIDLFFQNHHINNDFFIQSSEVEDSCLSIASFSSFLDALENELLTSGKLKSIDGNVFCHGMLDGGNIYLYKNLFKYKNLYYNFLGNPLFDLAFICISYSFNKHDRILLLKEYCKTLGLDLVKHKRIFDDCIYVASCLILYKNFFCIYMYMYITKNPTFLSSEIYNFLNLRNFFKKIKCFNDFENSKIFSSIFADFIEI